jgi:hypothetical protein
MSGMQMMLLGSGGVLDTQIVTTGGDGSAPMQDRNRGYSGTFGSIVDGTSDIYAGDPIGNIGWSENGGSPNYSFSVFGSNVTNSGWTTLTIGSKPLLRTDATFTALGAFGGVWSWNTTDVVGDQAFGTIGSIVVCTFT